MEHWFLHLREQDLATYKSAGFPMSEFDNHREQFKLHSEREGAAQRGTRSWSSAFLRYCTKYYAKIQHDYLIEEKPKPRKPPTPAIQEEKLSEEELKERREIGRHHIEKMKKLFGKR